MSAIPPTSSPEDCPMSSDDEDSPMSSDDEDSPYDSAVMCRCGLSAKLITSMNRSPYRLFYNCPRAQYNQCGFRQWFDEAMPTDSQHVDQINLISIECIQIEEKMSKMVIEQGQERCSWCKEREELNSQLSAAKSELNKIRREIKSNLVSAGCRFPTVSVSSPEDSATSSAEEDYSSRSSSEGYYFMSLPKNYEVTCFCGRLAKVKCSMTSSNPNRYFYLCPKRGNKQCGFFQWIDEPIPTGNRRVDEMNLISSDRNRLQERIDKMKEDWDRERSQWDKDKMELHLELSAVKDEIDKIKQIEHENDWLRKIKSEIELENERLVKIKSEIDLENDRLVNIKSEIDLENERLVKIKSEIELENERFGKIKSEIRIENDRLDKIKSEITLENDGLIKIKRIKLDHDGLDKMNNDGLDKMNSCS